MTDEIKQIAILKIVKTVLIILGGFIIACGIFWLGMIIGLRKASFNYQWGKNYSDLFERPERMVFVNSRGGGFIDANSAVGFVIKIDTSTLLIKGDDGVEKSILIGGSTVIRRWQNTILPDDIKVDEKVVILGVPSSTGQIEARLIRVMPAAPKSKF
jgi:hypothetical protein